MSEIDGKKLKEMVKALNAATYKNEEQEEVSFLETPIKVPIGVSVEKLAMDFATAVGNLSDDITGQLPDAVIDFYNETDFPIAETPKTKDKEEAPVATKAKVTAPAKKEVAPVAAKTPAKEKAPVAAKTPVKKEAVKKANKKEPAGLSVFGHKMNTQSAKLDALLAPGKAITMAELIKGSGRSEIGVKSHIKHLIEARKLTINVKDNVYRYDKKTSAK